MQVARDSGWCGQAGVVLTASARRSRGPPSSLEGRVRPRSVDSLSRGRPPQEYAKVIMDIDLAQRLRPGHPTATRLSTVVADLRLYEDEIRSVEGPAQTGAALKEPQIAHPMNRARCERGQV